MNNLKHNKYSVRPILKPPQINNNNNNNRKQNVDIRGKLHSNKKLHLNTNANTNSVHFLANDNQQIIKKFQKNKEEKQTLQDPKLYMERLKTRIEVYFPNKINALEKLKNEMHQGTLDKNISYFDEEDFLMIEKQILFYQNELTKTVEEYNQKNDLYTNALLRFETMLKKREEILQNVNNSTNLFGEVPNLKEFFDKKHLDIENCLNEIKKQICEQNKIL